MRAPLVELWHAILDAHIALQDREEKRRSGRAVNPSVLRPGGSDEPKPSLDVLDGSACTCGVEIDRVGCPAHRLPGW